MVAAREQCPYRPTITPNKTCSAIFTDASKEGWGACINERTARGTWFLPGSMLHIYYLELKAVFLALQEFQDLCIYKIVIVETDNTTVVSYINKEGGRKSGPLRALLWRILTWFTRNQVTPKARHIPGLLSVVADKQAIWARPDHLNSGLSFRRSSSNICSRWHWPQIDLWATGSTTSCLCISGTRFPDHSSGCTKSAMGGSGCICLPTTNHLGQSGGEVVGLPMQKNHSYCSGLAQHALVLGPSDHVESDPTEPGLLAQPVNTAFNQIPHRNLTNLNLHAWLLEPHHSRSRVFLKQWHKN